MIMRSIKSTFGSLIIRLYCHSCKFFIPSSGTHLYCFVKVPVRKFFLQVHCCIGTANGRNSNLYLYLFYIAEGEDAFYGCYFQLVPGFRRIIIVGCKLLYLLVALQHKIDFPGKGSTPLRSDSLLLYSRLFYGYSYHRHSSRSLRASQSI